MLNADFQLLRDINPTNETDGSEPADFVSVEGQIFFTASTATTGRELWVSDGSDGGTRIVKDIVSGVRGSNVQDLTASSGKLFFIADSHLWVTDGTEAGTSQVLEEPVYTQNGGNLLAFDGGVYFSANVASTGTSWRLMKTDGTPDGTEVVAETTVSASYLTVVGDQFFFNSGNSLWASDGTEAGTRRADDPSSITRPENLTRVVTFDEQGEVVERLFFTGWDSTHGFELWTSDGTTAGTSMVRDLLPGSNTTTRHVSGLTDVNGVLYFSADDGVNGVELWKSDGTQAGTEMVINLHPTGSSKPAWLTEHDGTLYFVADDGTHSFELWKSHGTAETTSLVKDINDTNDGFNPPSDLVSFGEMLYFNASNGRTYGNIDNGRELWVSDGTEAGTQLAVELYSGVNGGNPTNITVVGLPGVDGAIEATLIFSGQDSLTGPELWKSNGTQTGTSLIKDIIGGTGDSNPSFLTESGGRLYFSASIQSPPEHRELWVSDGTPDGTYLLKDLWLGSSSNPSFLTDVNGRLFFVANGADGAFRYGTELHSSDGTPEGTGLVKDINTQLATYGNAPSHPRDLTAVGNSLYFTADDGTLTSGANRELWTSDGTADGTHLVRDFSPADGSSSIGNLTDVDGTLYFTANVPGYGVELWKTDGTEAGTVLVKDIKPGTDASYPRLLTSVTTTDESGNATTRLFFFARDPSQTSVVNQLWVSEGTPESTTMLTGFTSANWPFENGADVDGTFFFTSGSKDELWKSDGTPEGTVRVKSFAAPFLSPQVREFTVIGSTLYFRVNQPESGYELWKSDGTEAGTVMVRDIWPGPESGAPVGLTNVNGTLYFTANDGVHGEELWASDGTEEGTMMVADFTGTASGGSAPTQITSVGSTLFVVATTDDFGTELFGSLESSPPTDDLAQADEDGPAVVIDVQANDSHAGTGEILNVSSVDTTGTLGLVTINANGTISYDPNGQFEQLGLGETATDTFTYTLTSNTGSTGTATVTVTIAGAADTLHWQGDVDLYWNNADNWLEGQSPRDGDSLVFDTETEGYVRGTSHNDIDDLSVGKLSLSYKAEVGNYITLLGNGIELQEGIDAVGRSMTVELAQIVLTATQTLAAVGHVSSGSITIRSPLENNGFDLSVTGNAYKYFQGVISGSGGVNVLYSGDTWFNAPNTYGGLTTVTSSNLGIQSQGRLGDTASPTYVNNAQLVVSTNIVNEEDVFFTGEFSALLLRSNAEQAGDLHVATSNPILVAYLVQNSGTAVVSGNIDSETSSPGLRVSTPAGATIILSGTNSYSGATQLISSATVQLGASDVLPDGTAVILSSGTTLDVATFDDRIGSLAGSGNVVMNGGTLSVGSDDTATSLSGTIGGTGHLVKEGSGTFTLSSANTFSGATTVESGRLRVDGSLAGTVDVSATGVLSGTGAVANSVTVDAGGSVAPGASAGALSTGNLTLSSESTLSVEINGLTPSRDYDQLLVNGTVDVSGASLDIQPGFTPAGEATFVLIDNDADDSVVGTFDGLPEGTEVLLNGEVFRISYQGGDGNDVVLTNRAAVYDFNAASVGRIEGDVPATDHKFEVIRSNNLLFASSVEIDLSGVTATSDIDFDAGPILVSFLPGETSKSIPISILGETMVEGDETIELSFANLSDNGVVGNVNPTATLTIRNDDTASVAFASDLASTEGTGGPNDFNFTVRLDHAVQGGFQLAFGVNDGTATANDDFEVLTSSPLMFDGYADESHSIAVRILGDSKVEADEAFQVALGALSGLSGIDPNDLTIDTFVSGMILNDDSSELTIDDVQQDEDTGEMIFTVRLGNAIQGGLSIDYQTVDGSAQDGESGEDTDYTSVAGRLTFSGVANETQTITVPINPDIAYEPSESLSVMLANLMTGPNVPGGTAQTIAFDDTAVGVILNDDTPNSLVVHDATLAEGDSGSSVMRFWVEMSNASSVPVSVGFRTVDCTATGGGGDRDYVAINNGSLTFSPGETLVPIDVSIVGDVISEVDETLIVELFDPVNGVILDGLAVGTIVNDDGTPILANIGDVASNEGDGGVTVFEFRVTLSQASTEIISIDYDTSDGTAIGSGSGRDYERVSRGTLSFAPGETSQSIHINVTGDQDAELDENFAVHLSNPTNVVIEDGLGEGTILNDDIAPTLISIDDVELPEGSFVFGDNTFVFTVTLSAPSDQPVSVRYETVDGTAVGSGNLNDYVRINQSTLTFAPGEVAKTISVTVIDDGRSELDESFMLRLSNPTNAIISDGEGVGTIVNNDVDPILISIADAAQHEGDDGSTLLEFVVALSRDSNQTINIDFMTSDGSASSSGNSKDYDKLKDRLIFAPGETTKSILVVVHGDTTPEPNESFFVTLSSANDAIFADNQALGEILDDDILP